MLARSETTSERKFAFTQRDFEAVRKILHACTGISLDDDKNNLVYGRLARRLRAHGFYEFSSYLAFLSSSRGKRELTQFVNALTTNLTAFFREPHHFDALAESILPEIRQRHVADRRIRFWSAGCSTGEEPYSLAMVVRETLSSLNDWDVNILATDLDSNVLAAAERGRYAKQRVAGLSQLRGKKWFHCDSGRFYDDVQIDPSLHALVTFKQLNLMQQWPVRGPFDIIFCRNVVIYFDKPTQRKLFNRYADTLVDGGYLFLGHSETLHKLCDRFELIGPTMYRKIR